jgi:membrane protein implicated in regulation of membrane protease activity
VFSTCNVKFWYFAVATFAALPKQIILVYLGVLLVAQKDQDSTKNILFAVSAIVTLVLAGYIYMKMRQTKKILLEEQEKRRQQREIAMESLQPLQEVEVEMEDDYSNLKRPGTAESDHVEYEQRQHPERWL